MEYKSIKVLLDKYLDGETSLREETLLKDYFQNNQQIPKDLAYAKTMFLTFKKENKVSAKQYLVKAKQKMYWLSGLAASVAIVLGILFVSSNDDVRIISKLNNSENVKEVKLSSNLKVWMNTGSAIEYENSKLDFIAKIKVEGEVFIEIGSDTLYAYEIEAANASIVPQSNCAINIDAEKENAHINVAVKYGTIMVKEKSKENGLALLVTAGNYCSVHRKHNVVFSANNSDENYLSWKTGELVFNNLPVANVVEVLEDYYGRSITIKNEQLAYCEFNGRFRNKSMDYILQSLTHDLSIAYSENNNEVFLFGAQCKP